MAIHPEDGRRLACLEKRLDEGLSYKRIAKWLHGCPKYPTDTQPTQQTISRWINDQLEQRTDEREELREQYGQLQEERIKREIRELTIVRDQIKEEIQNLQRAEDTTVPPDMFREARQISKQKRELIKDLRELRGLDEPEKTEHEVHGEVEHVWEANLPGSDNPNEVDSGVEDSEALPEGEDGDADILDAQIKEEKEKVPSEE